jgi:hypothetical protein
LQSEIHVSSNGSCLRDIVFGQQIDSRLQFGLNPTDRCCARLHGQSAQAARIPD